MEQGKKAIVTGATSGIGLAICETLLSRGYTVYGFGRDFDKLEGRSLFAGKTDPPAAFYAVPGDLLDTEWLLREVKKIDRDKDVTLLVNCAGAAYYGLHEEQNPQKIQEMVRTNLELPMVLTQQLLRTLKKNGGRVINISSVTATRSSPHGAAYAATKAGLLSFSQSLFEEARKTGLKVTAILPDMTRTDLYRHANFTASDEPGCALSPEDVARAVAYLLDQPDGVVVPEMELRPQYHRIERKKAK